ncbi:C-X-C chemokine receptor type 3 [Pelobates cultripes]|uniref:C-X-C chemokine receptor type 3 n=1 Tax=Pelobates cultripes TaxID=61616 RepID=A0AAD1T9G1_PELCU|nr:C-X-C chemokine receptor type 3 [Pelobates cultripes]
MGNDAEQNTYINVHITDIPEFSSSSDYQYSPGDFGTCNLEESKIFDRNFLPAFYSLLFLIGIIGNVLVMFVLLRNKHKLQSTDIFILNLAIADILLVLTLPFWASQAFSGWLFGGILCKIVGSLFKVNFYAGIFLLACISWDRYLSVVYAVQMFKKHRSNLIYWICLAVWCACLALCIPDVMYFKAEYDYRTNLTICQPSFPASTSKMWKTIMTSIFHILGFLLPFCGMVYCYAHIFHTLLKSNGFKKQRALQLVIAVVVAFFLCWTPYNIVAFVDTLVMLEVVPVSCNLTHNIDTALSVTSGLCYFHCCLNPFLYVFIGAKFKNYFIELLRQASCMCPNFMEQYVKRKYSARSSTWSESGDTSLSRI